MRKRSPSRGGAHLADELTKLLQIRDPSTLATVIVESVTGSGASRLSGVVACDLRPNGIFLILDEVITGFDRLGAAFGVNAFGVHPPIAHSIVQRDQVLSGSPAIRPGDLRAVSMITGSGVVAFLHRKMFGAWALCGPEQSRACQYSYIECRPALFLYRPI